MTQFQLSNLLRLRYDKAARVERGYHRPGLSLAVAIEQVCGIPVSLWLQPAPDGDDSNLAPFSPDGNDDSDAIDAA